MSLLIDNAPKVAGTVLTLTIIAYILLPLRFYTRIKNETWGKDDTSMAVAAVPFAALSAFCLGGSFHGIGVHKANMTASQEVTGLKYFFFFEIFYCATIIPIKLSISFMLMRIATPLKRYLWVLYGVSTIFTIMNAIAFFYILFNCTPVNQAWEDVGGTCKPAAGLADIYYATTAVNIVTDWVCALLPIPLLWSVQLNRNSKISVACILSLGVFASLSACIRLNYTINLTNADDYLYGIGDIVIWGYAENGIGLIVACIATLRPLFRRVLGLGASTSPSHTKSWPASQQRRTYPEYNHNNSYQMTPDERAGKGNHTIVRSKVASSGLSDTASEEYILNDLSGIHISKTVCQEASFESAHSPV